MRHVRNGEYVNNWTVYGVTIWAALLLLIMWSVSYCLNDNTKDIEYTLVEKDYINKTSRTIFVKDKNIEVFEAEDQPGIIMYRKDGVVIDTYTCNKCDVLYIYKKIKQKQK